MTQIFTSNWKTSPRVMMVIPFTSPLLMTIEPPINLEPRTHMTSSTWQPPHHPPYPTRAQGRTKQVYTTPKKKKSRSEKHTITQHQSISMRTKVHKVATLQQHKIPNPNIALVTQTWLGYQICKALATHWGRMIKKEKWLDKESLMTNTPLRKMDEFEHSVFPKVPQRLFPKWGSIGHHFTQLPRQETIVFDGFHITINFDTIFNNHSWGKAQGAL